MKIKIYDKIWSALTTLLSAGESDFNKLEYKDILGRVGSARFIMRLDSSKATLVNLEHYNKIEITDDDDTVRWTGVITQKIISLNTVLIRCKSLIYLLEKRVTNDNNVFNTQADTVITALLANANAEEDTGIDLGTNDITTNVQLTFNRASVLDAIKQVASAVSGQFQINRSRKLQFTTTLGSDLSGSVAFNYDIALIAGANIIRFNVLDDGLNIISKTFGKSGGNTSAQEDSGFKTSFGLHELFKNFRELDNQTTLDSVTADKNAGAEYSPEITLKPDVSDNFEVGDIVAIKLINRLISIDANHQILEKVVEFKGGQKQISIKVISNTSDFFKQLNDVKKDVELLSREV